MKALLTIAFLSLLASCSKESVKPKDHQRIDDYITFVSASKTMLPGNKAEATITVNVTNAREINDLHVYAFNDVYQLNTQVNNGNQSVTDKFIDPSTWSRQYYFVAVLADNERIEGSPFTANY